MKTVEAFLPFYMYALVEVTSSRTCFYKEGQIQVLNTHLLNQVAIGAAQVMPLLRPEEDMLPEETAQWYKLNRLSISGPQRQAAATRYLTTRYIDVHGLIQAGLAKATTLKEGYAGRLEKNN